MAITPEQAKQELARRELERRKSSQQQPQQEQTTQQQPNILQQLLQSTNQAVGNIAGGIIQPPVKIIGRAGQAAESMMTGKPPMNYSIPMTESMGGNIDIKPAGIGEGMADVGMATLNMLGLKGLMNPKSLTSGIAKVTKYDNTLKQANKAKEALDSTRSMLGKAKDIALQEVKDVPAELDWAGNVSNKVVQAIKNPVYKVEFTPEGGVVNTIGNLDKVKSALQDLVTTKDFVEAGNMEKRQIMKFAGRVRNTMLEAAEKAGKPELAKALKGYHEFMDSYEMIYSKLTDKFGNAMANKMKSMFSIFAEPATKEAWKEIGKISPEVKSVIGSMNRRELLKNLLKVSGGITAIGAGKMGLDLMNK